LFQESAGRDPDDPTIQYHLGIAHYMLGEEAPARVSFERAAASASDAPEVALARRHIAVLALDPAAASPQMRAELEQQAKANPRDPIVMARLAALQARGGSPAEAAAAFEKALALAPHNPDFMLALAQLYSGPLRRPDRARALAKSAHEAAPDDPRISRTLGRLLFETGDYAWSLDLLEEAGRGLAHEPALMYDLAQAYFAVGRIADADRALREALGAAAPFPERAQAEALATLLSAIEGPPPTAEALAQARAMLAAHPRNLAAQLVAGLAREQAGDAAGAAAVYEKLLAQDPVFTLATRQLARIYVQRASDDDRAYELARQARDAFPDDPGVATTLGIVDYRRGDYAGAALLLQESLRRRADDPETVFYLGMSHYNLKETGEGRQELQHALDLKLSGREADDARQALDEMKGDVRGPSLSSQPIN
jgi:Flp pilus assembly protein TadD